MIAPFLDQGPTDGSLPDPELLPEFYSWVWLKRFLAWVIDTILVLVLVGVTLLLTAFTGFLIFPLVFFMVNLTYRWVTVTRWSATPGMLLMAIELRTLWGYKLSQNYAFLHSLGFTVSITFPALQLISVALMLTSPYGQGLSDRLLWTTAINRPAQS